MSIAQRVIGNVALPRWAFVPLHDFYIAFGLIGIASSILAIAQAFDYHPFVQWLPDQAPGLFFNPTHASAALSMLAVTLWINNLGWFIPALLPGLYLAHSRGGWAALAVGFGATYIRQPLVFLIAALALGLYWAHNPSPSDLQRLDIWSAAWINLHFWGNGPDSFMNLYMGPLNHLIHPEYVHNDYLQTVFEYGIWSLIPFTVLLLAVRRTHVRAWPILVTFMFLATFTMPMHMPLPLTLGALALVLTIMEPLDA